MSNFERALKKVLKYEGGYVNDPDDPGGETYKGISRKNWPNWDGWKWIDAKRLGTADLCVKDFYCDNFWLKLKCHQIQSQSVAEILFDAGVNMGRRPAVRLLQQASNSIYTNPRPVIGVLAVDGLIGSKTLGRINSQDAKILTNKFLFERVLFYWNLCFKKPVMFKYLKGWTNRVMSYVVKK